MSIALVQSTNGTSSNSTSVAKAFASPNTAGNLLVVVVAWSNSGRAFTSLTDSLGNVYTGAFPLISTSTCLMRIFFVPNCKGGSNTVTLTIGGGANCAIAIHEYSGIDKGSPLDVQASTSNTTANPTTASVTDTVAGDLVFAACAVANTTLPTAGTGYTIRQAVAATTISIATEDQIDAGTNSHTGLFTHAAAQYCAGIATFKQFVAASVQSSLSMMGCGI